MAVTPSDLLAEARKNAASASSEPEFRNAVHCIYYAVFHVVLEHPFCIDFDRGDDGTVHRRLITYLKIHHDETLRKIAFRHLPRLRKLRNDADYALKTSFTRGDLQETLERANEVVAWLDALVSAAQPVE